MSEIQAARMPNSQPFALQVAVPSVSGGAASPSRPGSGADPATLFDWVSPEARQQFEQSQQLVTKLTEGGKQAKASDQAFRLAAAKEKLKELKMLAEMAAATGNAKLAKAVARDLATVGRQLGALASEIGQGATAASAGDGTESASPGPSAAPDPGGAGTIPAAIADGGQTGAVALTPGTSSVSPLDGQDVISEIHGLAVEAKKILDYLLAAPRLRGKANKELAAAAMDVGQAIDATAGAIDGAPVALSV